MTRRAGRNWLLGVVRGAILGLVTAATIEGLGHAAFIPLSHRALVRFRFETAAFACLVTGCLGWLFTLSLQHWFVALRKSSKDARTSPNART